MFGARVLRFFTGIRCIGFQFFRPAFGYRGTILGVGPGNGFVAMFWGYNIWGIKTYCYNDTSGCAIGPSEGVFISDFRVSSATTSFGGGATFINSFFRNFGVVNLTTFYTIWVSGVRGFYILFFRVLGGAWEIIIVGNFFYMVTLWGPCHLAISGISYKGCVRLFAPRGVPLGCWNQRFHFFQSRASDHGHCFCLLQQLTLRHGRS